MLLDKTNIKRAFAASAQHYDRVAALQRGVGEALLAQPHTLEPNATQRVLDIGCGTGFLTHALSQRYRTAQLYALD
jgi:malonyl-CoA O-methyltransferase